jgi:hypothetical protein
MRAVLARPAVAATSAARNMATVEARRTIAAPAVSLLLVNVLVCCPIPFGLSHWHCGHQRPLYVTDR